MSPPEFTEPAGNHAIPTNTHKSNRAHHITLHKDALHREWIARR